MQINFDKETGLIPAIVQDAHTGKVLMMGYMDENSLKITIETQKVTFFSRSRQKIWVKGETSGHFLKLESILPDCDNDTLLVKAIPCGPTCHTGADTCWFETNTSIAEINENLHFLTHLQAVIKKRKQSPDQTSYTSKLFAQGINKIAQKVGEEAVELVIEAKDSDKNLFLGEAADLLFHYLVLLESKGYTLDEVIETLKQREKK